VLIKYKSSDTFTKGLAVATQNQRRPILEHFADKCGPSGQRFGEKRIDTLQRRHILAIFEGMTRDMKRNWLKALRGLMAFAVSEQIRADDPTQGIKLE
jgi:site-specific recombinase XerD